MVKAQSKYAGAMRYKAYHLSIEPLAQGGAWPQLLHPRGSGERLNICVWEDRGDEDCHVEM